MSIIFHEMIASSKGAKSNALETAIVKLNLLRCRNLRMFYMVGFCITQTNNHKCFHFLVAMLFVSDRERNFRIVSSFVRFDFERFTRYENAPGLKMFIFQQVENKTMILSWLLGWNFFLDIKRAKKLVMIGFTFQNGLLILWNFFDDFVKSNEKNKTSKKVFDCVMIHLRTIFFLVLRKNLQSLKWFKNKLMNHIDQFFLSLTGQIFWLPHKPKWQIGFRPYFSNPQIFRYLQIIFKIFKSIIFSNM